MVERDTEETREIAEVFARSSELLLRLFELSLTPSTVIVPAFFKAFPWWYADDVDPVPGTFHTEANLDAATLATKSDRIEQLYQVSTSPVFQFFTNLAM